MSSSNIPTIMKPNIERVSIGEKFEKFALLLEIHNTTDKTIKSIEFDIYMPHFLQLETPGLQQSKETVSYENDTHRKVTGHITTPVDCGRKPQIINLKNPAIIYKIDSNYYDILSGIDSSGPLKATPIWYNFHCDNHYPISGYWESSILIKGF